jgi:IS5 family transposase
LLYLQHAFDLSDEEVVWQWVENPYWQVFTGETYLQTEPPLDPSSLTRWRKRLAEAGVEELLAETIEAAKRGGVIKASSGKRGNRGHDRDAQGDCASHRFALA